MFFVHLRCCRREDLSGRSCPGALPRPPPGRGGGGVEVNLGFKEDLCISVCAQPAVGVSGWSHASSTGSIPLNRPARPEQDCRQGGKGERTGEVHVVETRSSQRHGCLQGSLDWECTAAYA